MKALKLLLMHLFVTLLINKTTVSDNQHFLFNTLKNESKEFLMGSTFCTFKLIEKKYITEATILRCSIESSFKQLWVILLIYPITVGWHKLEPWTSHTRGNEILWELIPFHHCSFSTERIDYQLDSLSAVSNDAWSIFQK